MCDLTATRAVTKRRCYLQDSDKSEKCEGPIVIKQCCSNIEDLLSHR